MTGSSLAAGLVLAFASLIVDVSLVSGAPGVPTREGAITADKQPLSDAQIRKILIDESIAAYEGNCPCPYSTARNGSRCGKRSAYSRPGGAAPLCYAKDVTEAMVREYRNSHSEP